MNIHVSCTNTLCVSGSAQECMYACDCSSSSSMSALGQSRAICHVHEQYAKKSACGQKGV